VKIAARIAALALLSACAAATAATVHVRGSDGQWHEVEATTEGDIVSFTISPELAAGGKAVVVINKPDWMVLDDAQAPRVARVTVGGETLEPSPDTGLDLGALGEDEMRITLELSDDANPIDPDSAALRLDGGSAVPITVIAEDRNTHTATVEVDLSELGPGAYHGTITVADLSPLGNTAELPLNFSIAGIKVSEDGQTIRIAAGGEGFTVRSERQATVTVDDSAVSAYLTLHAGGPYLYIREFTAARRLQPIDGWQVIEVDTALEDIDGNPMSNEEAGVELRYLLAAHPDLPAVVVNAEATNISPDRREVYAFWGWLPGANYVTPDGESHEWTMAYTDIGKIGWLWIAPTDDNRPGVGWISPGVFGESRFGTMLLYTDPKRVPLESGERVETIFAIMPADSPEAVRTVAQALAASALEQFQGVAGE